MTNNEFLRDIEIFIEKTKMSATKFGDLAIDDPNFVFDVRNGRDTREKTKIKVYDFIKSHDSAKEGE